MRVYSLFKRRIRGRHAVYRHRAAVNAADQPLVGQGVEIAPYRVERDLEARAHFGHCDLPELLDQTQDFGPAHGRKRGIGLVLLGFHFGHDRRFARPELCLMLSHFKCLALAESGNVA